MICSYSYSSLLINLPLHCQCVCVFVHVCSLLLLLLLWLLCLAVDAVQSYDCMAPLSHSALLPPPLLLLLLGLLLQEREKELRELRGITGEKHSSEMFKKIKAKIRDPENRQES